jgi:thiamine-monophosphate kinase
LKKVASCQGWSLEELALSGGEDYELLLTVSPESYPAIAEVFKTKFGRPLAVIGTVLPGAPSIRWMKQGTETPFSTKGFDHFQKP